MFCALQQCACHFASANIGIFFQLKVSVMRFFSHNSHFFSNIGIILPQ